MLQDITFKMRLRYDKVCIVPICTCFRNTYFTALHTMLIWNMFQDGICFRPACNMYLISLLVIASHSHSSRSQTYMTTFNIFNLQHILPGHFHKLHYRWCHPGSYFTKDGQVFGYLYSPLAFAGISTGKFKSNINHIHFEIEFSNWIYFTSYSVAPYIMPTFSKVVGL